MKEFSTGLTPAQSERLTILAEEAAEVIQAVSKVLRHGFQSSWGGGPTNKEKLEAEIGNLLCAISRQSTEDLSDEVIWASYEKKRSNGVKFTHFQTWEDAK